jgi:hypothetical protein
VRKASFAAAIADVEIDEHGEHALIVAARQRVKVWPILLPGTVTEDLKRLPTFHFGTAGRSDPPIERADYEIFGNPWKCGSIRRSDRMRPELPCGRIDYDRVLQQRLRSLDKIFAFDGRE